MNFQASLFAVPATLVVALFLANCSGSDATDNSGTAGNPGLPATGGSSPGTAGKAGSAGSGTSGGGAGGGLSGVAGGSAGSGVGGGGAGSIGAAGSAGMGTAGGTAVEASFATVKAVIEASCFGNGCHSQEGNPLQMKVDDKLYGTLTTHMTAHCGKLLNTTNPADSGLIKVMQGDCGMAPNITYRMPWDKCFQGDTDNEFCVAPAKVAAIQAWIAKGAPQQ